MLFRSDMNCAACPITVKKALGKVAGVAKTEVDLEKREATVTSTTPARMWMP